MKPRYRPKKMTKAQKAVVPAMMAALVRSEQRTVEEIEKDFEGEGR
jgi:hypothetical protein